LELRRAEALADATAQHTFYPVLSLEMIVRDEQLRFRETTDFVK
jgi:hypothetical protein